MPPRNHTAVRDASGRVSRRTTGAAAWSYAPDYSPTAIKRVLTSVSCASVGNTVMRLALEGKLLPYHAEAARQWQELAAQCRAIIDSPQQTARAQDPSRVPGLSCNADDDSDDAKRKQRRIRNRHFRCEVIMGSRVREVVRRIVEMDEQPVGWADVVSLRDGLEAIAEALQIGKGIEPPTRH